MTASRDLVRFFAPEFDALDDATIDTAIGLAAQRISARAFDTLYPQAAALMAAHILAKSRSMATLQGVTGAVTSVRTGDLQISAAVVGGLTGSDAALATTPYGEQFLTLRDQVPVSPHY